MVEITVTFDTEQDDDQDQFPVEVNGIEEHIRDDTLPVHLTPHEAIELTIDIITGAPAFDEISWDEVDREGVTATTTFEIER